MSNIVVIDCIHVLRSKVAIVVGFIKVTNITGIYGI